MNGNALLFPLLAEVGASAAQVAPNLFRPLKETIVPLLVLIMFGTGMTLTVDDFRRVFRKLRAASPGPALQCTVMPGRHSPSAGFRASGGRADGAMEG